jgi:hypothetical protein
MIAKALVVASLLCGPINKVNKTAEAWNDYDAKIFKQVQKRCGELYPDAPCVKLFRKFDSQSYTVLCGAEETIKIERRLL